MVVFLNCALWGIIYSPKKRNCFIDGSFVPVIVLPDRQPMQKKTRIKNRKAFENLSWFSMQNVKLQMLPCRNTDNQSKKPEDAKCTKYKAGDL